MEKYGLAPAVWGRTITLLAIALTPAGSVLAADDPPAPASITYSRDVQPILKRHCVACHRGWFPKAGLRLDSLAAIRKGGRSGPAIVPGSPEKGWLPRSLSLPNGARGKMPPGEERLSPEEMRLIETWIRQGAR